MATKPHVASLRKPATAAARGVTLALHASAGLADSVHRESARLLRASEGLARAALALLEASAKPAVLLANTPRPRQDGAQGPKTAKPDRTTGAGAPGGSDGPERKTGVDAVQPGSTPEGGSRGLRPPRDRPVKGDGTLGSKVKPERRKNNKTKDNLDKKGVTKNNSDEDGKGKEKTVATPVATAPVGEMDLDDKWADQAFVPSASNRASAPMAKHSATARQETVPTVTPGVTVTTLELGYEDTLLRLGDTATVVSTENRDKELAAEKGTLLDFDGEAWGVKMTTGTKKELEFSLPSLYLQGQETVP